MTNFFLKKDIFIKYIPFYMTIILSSISSTIYPPNGYAMTFSFVPLICILFWSLVLGRYFGPLQFFFIGIVTDLLMGTPIGSYLFLFAIIRFISLKVKEKFQIKLFYENVIAATTLILVFYLLNNLFLFVYYSKFIVSEYFLLNIILTIFLYPAFAVFFTWLYKITSLEKYYVKT
tara:strand:+ start:1732 stop:2256 length:525 start_codon:yes stop_codon:yes gene_type:complete